MKRQWTAGSVAAVLLAAFVAAGCGTDGNGNGNGATNGAQDFDGNVTVGAILPLTGDLSAFGEAGSQALDLAEQVINDAASEAGLEGQVTIAKEDGETTDAGGRSAAETLVRGQDVSCIVGDWASSSTLSVARSVTIQDGVPLISPASTAGELTELDDDGTVFRTVPSDSLQANLLAEAIADDLGGEGTVRVAARNNAYGVGLAEAFQAAAEEQGLTVDDPILMDPDTPQADAEARQITQGSPDAFLIVDYPQAWQTLGPALARTGNWDAERTWTADGLRDANLPNTAGEEVTNGMRGTAPTSEGAPAADAFNTLWDENADGERQTYDADNFDAAILCYLAAIRAGSSDPGDIRDNLQAVSGPPGEQVTFEDLSRAIELLRDGEDIDYEGAAGPINWDENGDPSAANYEIWQYEGGELRTVEQRSLGGDEEGADGTTTNGVTNGDAAG